MTTRSVQEVGERLGYEARDVLEALLETVADAVYVVDKDGRVAFANPAALACWATRSTSCPGTCPPPLGRDPAAASRATPARAKA